jgi:hypothetical protein
MDSHSEAPAEADFLLIVQNSGQKNRTEELARPDA